MKRFIIFSLQFLFLSFSLSAQISHGGEPLSFKQILRKSAGVFSTPNFDYQRMLKEDTNADKKKPFRYAKIHEVNLSPENAGTWSQTSNGEKIWQLRILSKNAYSIGLIFNKFDLASGTRMFVFSSDKKRVIGSFTEENNKSTNWFSTIPLAGDDIIIELDVVADKEYGELNISGISHDYKNAFGLKTGYGESGSCNININCPEGGDWQIEKRAVVRYSYGSGAYSYFCTGVLVNNTAFNKKPYLLTAEHCVSSQISANSAIFMFNYESENCISTNEPTLQSISSATLLATGDNIDFTLLELSDNPPASYNVYFAGWNRSTTPAQKTVTIHHPQGDIKKIGKDFDAPVVADYGEGYLFNSHWNILRWDLGTTEQGSSGAPLFDQNHRIVGNLTGGAALCGNSVDDYFSRFDKGWDYYSLANKQLKAWLDPAQTGVEVLDGLDPNAVTVGTDVGIIQIISPQNSICIENGIIPEVTFQNKGSIDLTDVIIGYKLSDGTIGSQNWKGSLKPFEIANIKFESISTPSGTVDFKAFSSKPNGIDDINLNNDTLLSTFFVEQPMQNVLIEGNKELCSELSDAKYTTSIDGNYHWEAIGGTILDKDTTKTISVRWDDWGDKYIKLNVTNLCNSIDAEPVKIETVEQSLKLEIQTGSNAESVCWSFEDCEGNIIYQKCGLLANDKNVENLCVTKGCYQLKLNSQSDGIINYSLTNLLNDEVISEGLSITGTVSEEFTLDASKNLASFNVYPNPAQSELVIEASFEELYTNSQFAFYNVKGEIVIPRNNLDERKTIDITNLPKGIYIIEITTPYGKYSKKIVKP